MSLSYFKFFYSSKTNPKNIHLTKKRGKNILCHFDEKLQFPKAQGIQDAKKNLTILKIHSIILILKQGGTKFYDKKRTSFTVRNENCNYNNNYNIHAKRMRTSCDRRREER